MFVLENSVIIIFFYIFEVSELVSKMNQSNLVKFASYLKVLSPK